MCSYSVAFNRPAAHPQVGMSHSLPPAESARVSADLWPCASGSASSARVGRCCARAARNPDGSDAAEIQTAGWTPSARLERLPRHKLDPIAGLMTLRSCHVTSVQIQPAESRRAIQSGVALGGLPPRGALRIAPQLPALPGLARGPTEFRPWSCARRLPPAPVGPRAVRPTSRPL